MIMFATMVRETLVAVAVVIIVTVVVVQAVRFVRFCLADLANSTDVRMLTRHGWALLIVLTIPLGGALYLLYGRGPRRFM